MQPNYNGLIPDFNDNLATALHEYATKYYDRLHLHRKQWSPNGLIDSERNIVRVSFVVPATGTAAVFFVESFWLLATVLCLDFKRQVQYHRSRSTVYTTFVLSGEHQRKRIMNTLTATQSAPIAESLNNLHDAYPFWGSGWGAMSFLLLTWIAIAGLGLLLSWRFATPVFVILGFVAGVVAGLVGSIVMSSYQDGVHAEQTVALKDVVIENIEENYALDDIAIEDHNARGGRSAPEQYTAEIFGSTATEYVRFEVAYNAEHDIMMPVQDLENTIDIPVRDDSRLAGILD